MLYLFRVPPNPTYKTFCSVIYQVFYKLKKENNYEFPIYCPTDFFGFGKIGM